MAGPIEVLSKVIISQYHSTLDTEAVQAHTPPLSRLPGLARRGADRVKGGQGTTGEDNFRLGISVLFAPRVPRLSTILLRNYSCRTARATPYCCAAPLLSHRHADTDCHAEGCYPRAADATLLPLPGAAATLLLRPHCCCHTAAAILHRGSCSPTFLNATQSWTVGARRPTRLPEGPPPRSLTGDRTPRAVPKGGSQGRRRRHPSPPCATARRGRPEAYPKGRPHPLQVRSDPAPPEI